jgi:hypothetical protein
MCSEAGREYSDASLVVEPPLFRRCLGLDAVPECERPGRV